MSSTDTTSSTSKYSVGSSSSDSSNSSSSNSSSNSSSSSSSSSSISPYAWGNPLVTVFFLLDCAARYVGNFKAMCLVRVSRGVWRGL